jgi:hypothetical protein
LAAEKILMEMNLYDTNPGKLCWVKISKAEALALIKSLVNQLQGGPNSGRLESRCKGDCTDLSIAIKEN